MSETPVASYKCPWCGCAKDESFGREGNPLYAHWSCGSYTFGTEPSQSDACRINELEAEVERLRGLIQYALDGPDDVAVLHTLLQDALDGVTGSDDCMAIRAATEKGESDGE